MTRSSLGARPTIPRPAAAPAPEPVTPACLGDARELVWPQLRHTMNRLHPTLRRISGYHLGWSDRDGVPVRAGGGKAVRGGLALLSARAAGAETRHAVPAAVAVELIHNFSLLHDDVMDGDTERRGRPTVWTVFGTPLAILAGDALLTTALEVVSESGKPGAATAVTALIRATQQLITGQAADLEFEDRADVTLDETLAMAGGKTGALFDCACSIGAQLVGAPSAIVEGLAVFGAKIGLAFQVVDDLLGIWGDPVVTGKPVLNDIRNRKKSIPVLAALGVDSPESARLEEFYAERDAPAETELPLVARLIEHCGGRGFARDLAAAELREAGDVLAGLDIPDVVRTEFVGVADFMVRRDW